MSIEVEISIEMFLLVVVAKVRRVKMATNNEN
jgi:hypothetical protein